MQGKGEPLPLQPIPKTKNNNKTKTNNKIKVVYTEDWTHPICRAISDETGRDTVWQDSKTIVERLNRMMIGWANYFCLGPVSKAYSAVDMHARRRLRRWLCDKHKEPRPAYKRSPEASLHSVYGLVQLPHRTANLPWAKT